MKLQLSKSSCLVLLVGLLASCAPEVGSEAWCDAMAEKPKGDWTVNEGIDFAKHCVIRSGGDE